MKEIKIDKYLMALNAAYTMINSGRYSTKLDTLDKTLNIAGIHTQKYIYDIVNKENIKV